MLEAYEQHIAERAALGVPPLPLDAGQVAALTQRLLRAPERDGSRMVELLTHAVAPGVGRAAHAKAAFLAALARREAMCPLIEPARAVELLGTMLGGYNVTPLVELLDSDELGALAAEQLEHTLLVFDAFHDVVARARANSANAQAVLRSWADARWFTNRKALGPAIELTVFRIEGEINTDELSPAQEAWSRADIPLHARSLLQHRGDGEALSRIAELERNARPVALVADIVGTGSSRKSAVNSLLWAIGRDIPYVPNKRQGAVVLGAKIAPIFFNTLEDAGALPIECDVGHLRNGDVIVLKPYDGCIENEAGDALSEFSLKSPVLLDSVQAGGRLALIIGRTLTARARAALSLASSTTFRKPCAPVPQDRGYTLAQKIVGRACDVEGVRPGTYCEPRMSTVASQDTTGPMNREELKELACLGFSADLVLQSFCHTAAYPKPVDIETQATLPGFMVTRGGVSLRPGDGIIHSWLNRMLLPDQVGTGSDSHTRFPLGISFPAGSGLVAFSAALGVMPLDMPESVLVRFSGEMRPGVTLRDLVNAIPYVASQRGLVTLDKAAKKNVFSGRIIEIEGLGDLSVEQAFELSDATAERSALACTVELNESSVADYLRSNVALLRWMIEAGYEDRRALERRALAVESWLSEPVLLRADEDARYAATIEIELSTITEPLLACPNDPDDVRPLSAVAGRRIDEVFIGSCMTNIGHFRAAGKLLGAAGKAATARLWIAPPTKMDEHRLKEEGYYDLFAGAGARTELPGCSLCMGNQARVAAGATVVSTSTRNFPNRMGQGAQVFLASAELAAVAAIEGELPAVSTYRSYARRLDSMAPEIYRYLQFDAGGKPL
ncbi:MAG: bifunctional aconitate hydratase 2/2-methylisocitrate dehydratase [Gammaproteobacteria bacterium]